MTISTDELARSLRDIDDLLANGDLEEALQDMRDLAGELHLPDLRDRVTTQLATWRRLRGWLLGATREEQKVEFTRHTEAALETFRSLERRARRVAETAPQPAAPPPARESAPPAGEALGVAAMQSGAGPQPADPPARTRLVCKGVGKQYRRMFRIDDVSFALHAGQVLGVVGENGSGKTTLLRILAGDLAADRGEIVLDDSVPGTRGYLARVAYVPQRSTPWSHTMTVHLQWHAALAGARTVEMNRDRLDDVLTWLQLSPHRDKKFGELSEGQRMRVAIATAILSEPALLILDEPLAPLDPLSQLQLLGWIRRRTSEWRDTMTLLSSQHVPEIELVADRTLFLRGGGAIIDREVRAEGSVYEVTPHDDRAGFDQLKGLLEDLCARRIVAEVLLRGRYAAVAVLHEPAPLHVFAAHIHAASPRMIRDVSRSARQPLLVQERP